MNLLTHFKKITILRFVLAGLVLLFSVPALFADGIASRYPNDVGIQNDPDVLLYDGFESYSHPEELRHENGGPRLLTFAEERVWGSLVSGRMGDTLFAYVREPRRMVMSPRAVS